MPEESRSLTNIDSNLWANAMRAYEADRGAVDRAQGRLRKNQLAYEKQGVTAKTIRDRYKERNMTREERQQLYAEEVVSRRALALTLWDAESAEDFDRLMERATAVQPADETELTSIDLARIYNDAFNSGAKGGMAIEDNPYEPGSAEHQQWAMGCADGIGEKPREAPPMQAAEPEVAQTPARRPGRPKGSPNRKTASALLDDNAAKLNGDQPAEDAGFFGGAVDEMPATADLPE